jgi:pimeloyl-ACP methyl ester carboxylesterase
MRRIAGIIACCLLVAVLPGGAGAKGRLAAAPCFDRADTARNLKLTVDGAKATGRYALPAKNPTTLVVFAHGYSHKSDSWIDHMREAAAEHGVAAVTMDYRGTYIDKDGNVRGWFVKEGAADMIAATHHFQSLCASIVQTVLFGVSMGGNASGLALALAKDETNATGGPLFDYWFNVEGAVNVLETYAGASALAPVNEFAALAKADIEDEMDGTLADDPEGYADLAVVNRMDEIKASGVKGVVMVHGVEDGLVPYNQNREIFALLRAQEIFTESWTMVGKGDGESGTTITGYSGNNSSPGAGHASETSDTHVVMVKAFERLWSLVDDEVLIVGFQEHVEPGI